MWKVGATLHCGVQASHCGDLLSGATLGITDKMEARPYTPSLCSRMKELGFVILTCFFISSAELTEENIKVLTVFERSKRRHKAFCSCAQRIIHKVNH